MVPLTSVAEYADAALIRAMNGNAAGEIPNTKLPWACAQYGTYGHSAFTCIHCITNFMNEKGDN